MVFLVCDDLHLTLGIIIRANGSVCSRRPWPQVLPMSLMVPTIVYMVVWYWYEDHYYGLQPITNRDYSESCCFFQTLSRSCFTKPCFTIGIFIGLVFAFYRN